MTTYEVLVLNKNSEDILATPSCAGEGPTGEYLRVAAKVRGNQELIKTLQEASSDSGRLQRGLLWLTVAIVVAAVVQALATLAIAWS